MEQEGREEGRVRGRKKYRGKREDGGRRDRWSRGRGRREEVRGRREGREWREGGETGAAGAEGGGCRDRCSRPEPSCPQAAQKRPE